MLLPMRQAVSFLDPVRRAWECKFIPKDMPMSEWSVHNTTMLRLGFLREQMMGLGPGFQDAGGQIQRPFMGRNEVQRQRQIQSWPF